MNDKEEIILTQEEALRVHYWRVTNGCSWRRVADNAAKEWPDRGFVAGNQEQGAMLCDAAASVLGEKSNEPPWN